MSWRHVILAACLAASSAVAGDLWQDLVPGPKEAKLGGTDWTLPADARIVIDEFPKARIGAAEINQRLEVLGCKPLPVVVWKGTDGAPADSGSDLAIRVTSLAKNVAERERLVAAGLRIDTSSSGKQGYIIRFVKHEAKGTILLAGTDEMGALHACVSFRWLVEKGPDSPLITPVDIRDWPDFKWRGAPSVMFVASNAIPRGNEGKVRAVKAFIDWCLRRKINVLRDYYHFYPGQLPKGPIPWIAEANRYAQERGFLTFVYQSTAISSLRAGKEHPDIENCALVSHKRYFTWADDDALLKRTRAVAEMCAENGFNLLCLHPPDGGGVMDPSQYSKRSDYDRRRWRDEERAEADAHVYNMFYREARKLQPEIRLGLTIYPYSPIYLDYEAMKQKHPELNPDIYRRNVTGYYAKLRTLLPADVHVVVREAQQDRLKKYRAEFDPRPAVHWCDFAGRWHRQPYFTSTLRYIGTSWHGNDDDVLASMHTRIRPNLVNYCGSAEFAWNTQAPGAKLYDGTRSEVLRDAKEPRAIFEDFVSRACRNIWGQEAGPLMAPIFQHGLSAALLARTATVLDYVNRPRRATGRPDVQFTTAMAKEQADAAALALPGIERVIREKPTMDPCALRTAVYYYRRVRLLDAIARLRHHIMLGTELADADEDQGAMAQVKAGRELLKTELPQLRQMAQETAKMPNLTRKFVDRKRDVYSLLLRKDVDFDRYRKALVALERRLLDKNKKLTPIVHTGTIRVGVYNAAADGGQAIGHQGVLMTFEGKPGVEVEFITDLSIDSLVRYDCIVYPQCALGQSSTRYDFFTGLRRYVEEAGGAVWYMHDSVGNPRSEFGLKTTFPQVCRGAKTRVDSNRVRLIRHPITKDFEPGTFVEHSYFDHWLLRRSKEAGRSVLMGEKGVVWVAGQVGKGRVLYDGTIVLDKNNNPAPAAGAHEKLMLAALQWLTQR